MFLIFFIFYDEKLHKTASLSDILDDYINVYLQEEITGEGRVRQLSKFERFLEVAVFINAEEINYSNIAWDVMKSPLESRLHNA